MRFYSEGAVDALFLRHDGFVGAIGAHLRGSDAAGSYERMPSPAEASSEILRSPRPRAQTPPPPKAQPFVAAGAGECRQTESWGEGDRTV